MMSNLLWQSVQCLGIRRLEICGLAFRRRRIFTAATLVTSHECDVPFFREKGTQLTDLLTSVPPDRLTCSLTSGESITRRRRISINFQAPDPAGISRWLM